jgi:hypothetical protein
VCYKVDIEGAVVGFVPLVVQGWISETSARDIQTFSGFCCHKHHPNVLKYLGDLKTSENSYPKCIHLGASSPPGLLCSIKSQVSTSFPVTQQLAFVLEAAKNLKKKAAQSYTKPRITSSCYVTAPINLANSYQFIDTSE